jgi:hypothetical protein
MGSNIKLVNIVNPTYMQKFNLKGLKETFQRLGQLSLHNNGEAISSTKMKP